MFKIIAVKRLNDPKIFSESMGENPSFIYYLGMQLRLLLIFTLLVSFSASAGYSSCFGLTKAFVLDKKKAYQLKEKHYKSLGMEFEGAVPKNISNETIAYKIRNLFQDIGYNSSVIKNPIGDEEFKVIFWKNEDVERKIVTVLDDPSLSHMQKDRGIEITSPIMTSNDDVLLFKGLLQQLKMSIGLRTDEIAGIHIHYGVEDITAKELKAVYQFFFLNAERLKKKFNFHTSRMLEHEINMKKTVALLEDLDPDQKVNELKHINYPKSVISYSDRYETIEIRLFNSSLDFREQEGNLSFSAAILRNILAAKHLYKSLDNIYKNYVESLDPNLEELYSSEINPEQLSEDSYLSDIMSMLRSKR